MLEPKEFEISGKTFVLSKFPATVGRELLVTYVPSGMPKVGDYNTNEALMLKIMSYVGVMVDGRDEPLKLTTRQLVDNHVPDGETLMKLEMAMASYNFSFFGNGQLSGFLEQVTERLTGTLSKILTDLLPLSQAKDQAKAEQP